MKTNLISDVQNDVRFEQTNGNGMGQIGIGILMVQVMAMQFIPIYIVLALSALWIPVFNYVRKRYIIPRIGFAKLKQKPELKSVIWGVSLALVIAVAFVGIASRLNMDLPTDTRKVWLGVMIGFVVSFVLIIMQGFIDKRSKWALYNAGLIICLLVSLFFGILTETRGYITLMVYALFNIIVGVVRFVHFVRTTPEVNDEN